jgi:glutaredoxin domain-containing cysteine-rich protein 1
LVQSFIAIAIASSSPTRQQQPNSQTTRRLDPSTKPAFLSFPIVTTLVGAPSPKQQPSPADSRAEEAAGEMDDIGGGAPGACPKNKKPRHLSRSLTYHHHPYQGRQLLPAPAPNPQRPQSVVLYTTSLRGVRRTFADCCAVRAALRGLRVAVDERDVSMDAALRRELQGILAARGRGFSLPQLLVGGALVGGADEVRRLHESGELRRVLEGAPGQDPAFVCGACGGFRFAPCPACDGSRKVFVEEEGRARRCLECNENGLVRCPNCCS